MKKLFIVALCIACGAAMQAQTGLQVGIDGAFNSTWIANQNNYGYTELNYERTFGGGGGLSIGSNFSETMGWQAELNFEHTGQNYFDIVKDFSNINDGSGKPQKVDTYRFVSLNYLQIPIMFRYQTEKEKKDILVYHASIGPAFGFLLSADQHYEADTTYTHNLVSLPLSFAPEPHVQQFAGTPASEAAKDYFSKVDFGAQLEVGLDVYIKKYVYLTPAAKVFYGLTDINSAPARELVDPASGNKLNYKGASHNLYGGISIGVHVNLGEE